MMDESLNLIRELRVRRESILRQVSDIDKRIRELKKQHFGVDEEKPFTLELLKAVLMDYLTQREIRQVIGNLDFMIVAFGLKNETAFLNRLRGILRSFLDQGEIAEIIEKLREV